MNRWLVAGLCVVLACGGKKSNDGTVPASVFDGKGDTDPNAHAEMNAEESATADSSATQPPIAPADACARVVTLKGQGCAWAQRFPPEFSDPAVCQRSLELWFSPQTEGHADLARSAACWALDCDAAAACMIRVKSSQPPPKPRECGTDGTGAVYVDKAMFAKRRGAEVSRFADIKTTEAEPVEVCGIDGEVAWMTRATCNGGTHPFPTPDSANAGRDSYMAKGGRCNSVLDRYTVACPEATYTIHVDRYVCPMP